jgi:hypothetical protein
MQVACGLTVAAGLSRWHTFPQVHEPQPRKQNNDLRFQTERLTTLRCQHAPDRRATHNSAAQNDVRQIHTSGYQVFPSRISPRVQPGTAHTACRRSPSYRPPTRIRSAAPRCDRRLVGLESESVSHTELSKRQCTPAPASHCLQSFHAPSHSTRRVSVTRNDTQQTQRHTPQNLTTQSIFTQRSKSVLAQSSHSKHHSDNTRS